MTTLISKSTIATALRFSALASTTLFATLVSTPAHAGDFVVLDRIAVVVNSNIILQSEVDNAAESFLRGNPQAASWMEDPQKRQEIYKNIIDGLVAEKLLEQEVSKLRLDVNDAEIENAIKMTREGNNLSEEQFEQALLQQGLSLEEYRDVLKKQLTKIKIIQMRVRSQVQVTDQDVKNAILQDAALRAGDVKLRARHILLLVQPSDSAEETAQKEKAALDKMQELASRVKKGEDFSSLARIYSEDTGSKEKGGSLGTFGRGEMVPEFEKASFGAKEGQLVGPVRTSYGWHLILVDERMEEEAPSISDLLANQKAFEAVRGRLFEAETERAFKRYIEDLRRSAYVEIRKI